MSGRHRLSVAILILAAVLAAVVLVAVAGRACPVETVAQPCPDAARTRVLIVILASVSMALLVTPFAFLGEIITRRRIVYRGAWLRAARRGLLAGLVVATLAGLRLGGALSVPVAIFVVILAAVIEWLAARRER